jgi:tetratricopeptide (TPR) repeat protein
VKKYYKLLVLVITCCCVHFSATAQNQTNDLIKQGVDLHNQGKYAEAISKFEGVLKTDPEKAFSLYASKKPEDAIPHLEKAVKSTNISLSVAAYALLASIYDEVNKPKKAIETYKEAIKINPDYPQIYYNLGIAYSRDQQYADAENAAIEAIKHSKTSGSMHWKLFAA